MSEMLFSFEGRINRKPFWMFMLVVAMGRLITSLIDLAITGQDTGAVSIIFMLIIFWPSLAINVKRWHDRDKSG